MTALIRDAVTSLVYVGATCRCVRSDGSPPGSSRARVARAPCVTWSWSYPARTHTGVGGGGRDRNATGGAYGRQPPLTNYRFLEVDGSSSSGHRPLRTSEKLTLRSSSTELLLIGFLRSSFLAVTKGWRSPHPPCGLFRCAS